MIFENPGLGFSLELQGCGSTETCFDISVQRTIFSEILKSVVLLVPEIKVLKKIHFSLNPCAAQHCDFVMSFWERRLLKPNPEMNIVNLNIYILKLETLLVQNLLKLLIQC